MKYHSKLLAKDRITSLDKKLALSVTMETNGPSSCGFRGFRV